MTARPRHGEGDWFAVPLRTSGYAVGLIARANPDGILVGYFFGPRRDAPPPLGELAELHSDQACVLLRFGDLGLLRGTWPLLGKLDGWDRSAWPMPVFGRFEELTGRSYAVYYSDDDPSLLCREVEVAQDDIALSPSNDLYGAGAVEVALTRLLG